MTFAQEKTIEDKLDQVIAFSESLDRAMYGDARNEVKGLLERVAAIESWVTQSKLKIAYISGGVAMGLFGLKLAWEWIVEHWRKL